MAELFPVEYNNDSTEDESVCNYDSDTLHYSNIDSHQTLTESDRDIKDGDGNNPKRIELPAKLHGIPERIIEHTAYTLSFNTSTNLCNWVAWELTSSEVNGRYGRTDDFCGDPMVPENHRVDEYAYRESGYDRGHMCPAAENKWSTQAMSESFFMSNMCPQNPTLNRQWWAHLEEAERRWANNEGKIYIVCGPIYNTDRRQKTIGSIVPISVPDGFFKVILSIRKGHEKAIGFYYRNRDNRQPMGDAACTVDSIEALTGMDFFFLLDDDIENKVESEYNLSKWN